MQLHIRACVTGGSISEELKDKICVALNVQAGLTALEYNISWDKVDSKFIRLHELNRIDEELQEMGIATVEFIPEVDEDGIIIDRLNAFFDWAKEKLSDQENEELNELFQRWMHSQQ